MDSNAMLLCHVSRSGLFVRSALAARLDRGEHTQVSGALHIFTIVTRLTTTPAQVLRVQDVKEKDVSGPDQSKDALL
ncbi:hypothetical protein CCMA1212_003618 [Trichoderma ghanense]|uniref:Uncharacterized protein n=1 Tax=Trichoderma ghanense TaxID=65468 RepID=A0ABY2H9R8_9HYPO